MNADAYNASALFAMTFAIQTSATLLQKGLLSIAEVKETIDRCQLNFEVLMASKEDDQVLKLAHALCESAYAQVEAQNRK